MAASGVPGARELLDSAIGYELSGALDRALDALSRAREATTSPAIVAETLRHEADIYRTRCEWDKALEAARLSAEVAQAAGLTPAFAEAINAEAAIYHTRGSYATAERQYRRILELPVDDRIRGIAYQNLALVSIQTDHHEAAEKYFQESIEYFQRAGYDRGVAIALVNYGRSRLDQKDATAAVPLLRDAERRALLLGDLDLLAMARLNYAEAALESGDDNRAYELICIALGHFDTTRNAYRRVEALRILGDIHRRAGQLVNAQTCYEHALTIAERVDAVGEIEQLKQRLATQEVPD